MKLKKMALLMAGIMLATTLTGCGAKENGVESGEVSNVEIATEITEPVSIDFWHAMTGENEVILKEITETFNGENEDGITVNLVYQGHYKELFSKLEGASKSNQLPALAMIYANRLTAYVKNDLVENLNPYIENEKVGFDKEIWEDIPVFLRDNGMWEGIHRSLPFNKSTFLLFYNEDMLNEKGIKPPTTWAELEEASKVLTVDADGDGKNETYGLGLNASVGIDSSFWVKQAGGDLIDEENDKILFNSDETAKAFDFLSGMIKNGTAQIANEEKYITGAFSRGEAAMGVSSMSALPDIMAACEGSGVNFKTVLLPKGEKSASAFSGTDITIFNTQSPEAKLAAFKYIKYFFEEEPQMLWGTKSGYLPLRNKVLNSDDFAAFAETESPSKAVAKGAFDGGYCDPKVLNGYAIHENMDKALQQIILEEKSTKDALQEAEENTRIALDEAKKAFGE